MRQATREAREREKTATKIRAARYDAANDLVVTELSTGATLGVPRRAIPGFAHAAPRDLADIRVDPGAESLWSDTVDDGVLLEQLIEIAAGEGLLKIVGGRISGRRRSTAKAAAARANGAKGGRPPLTIAEFIRQLERRIHELSPSAPAADVSREPNPKFPAGAVWKIDGRTVLDVGIHGHREVQIRAAWRRKRPVERRIRAIADRVAGELARWLVENRETSALTTLAANRSTRHGRSRAGHAQS